MIRIVKQFVATLSVLLLFSVPATALRDTAVGAVTKAGDAEIVAVFGEHEQNTAGKSVVSGQCRMHWGTLTLHRDGQAILRTEMSALLGRETWRGQFQLFGRNGEAIGTVPASGEYQVELKKQRPRTTIITIPMRFDPDVINKLGVVKMAMEC